ncbi:UNVERIFIED_CONTAM: Rap1 GTPase-GDP dissociation stimulator 1 [Gekko kuhli]
MLFTSFFYKILFVSIVFADTETSEKIQKSGILQVFASLLTPQSSCTAKVANIIAEVAKNEFMRNSCVEAGLIPPLVQLLNCKDQEVLLQTGRALGNICYDSHLDLELVGGGNESDDWEGEIT